MNPVLEKARLPRLLIGYGLCLAALLLAGCGDDSATADAPTHEGHENHEAHDALYAHESGSAQADGLQATAAYLRQPAPGQTTLAAFVTFKNSSDKAFTLHHVSSPRAASVEVHRTLYDNGVMSMRHVHHLVVPPRSELVFKPGDYHLMLSDVSGEVKPGDRIPLRFSFEGGTQIDVIAEVRPVH